MQTSAFSLWSATTSLSIRCMNEGLWMKEKHRRGCRYLKYCSTNRRILPASGRRAKVNLFAVSSHQCLSALGNLPRWQRLSRAESSFAVFYIGCFNRTMTNFMMLFAAFISCRNSVNGIAAHLWSDGSESPSPSWHRVFIPDTFQTLLLASETRWFVTRASVLGGAASSA